MTKVYKILPRGDWTAAQAQGVYAGSALDLKDGYIHLSTAAQAQETARRHFAGQTDLVLLTLDAERLGQAIRWEPSRGGDLFPHLYGVLDVAEVEAERALHLNPAGWPDPGALDPGVRVL